jgi:multiple sugar transport system substrate-binding protein
MNRRLSRRKVLTSTVAAGAAVAANPWLRSSHVQAQGETGKISVAYEDAQGIVEPILQPVVDELVDANPGAEIELKKSSGNYLTQLSLALATGRGPDAFILSGLGIGDLSAAGFVEPLDPYLANWDGWTQIPEPIKTAIAYQGQVWALPYVVDTHFLYYRKDVFTQAGLDPNWQPATPDDVLAAARQIKANTPDVIPYALYAGANGGNGTAIRGFLPLVYAYGGAMQDETGLWIIDSCAIRQALAYYATAYQTDQTVPQQVMTAADPAGEVRDAFGRGDLGIVYDGSWTYGDWIAANPANAETIGFALHPRADGAAPFAVGGIGNCWYINAKSQSKDLAWELIKAMNTAEIQAALNLADLHIPARADAAADPGFQATPFNQAMVASVSSLVLGPPAPEYRELIPIVQNATGIVATGQASPEEAVQRYASELTRVLGEDRVVAQPCP